MNRQISGFGWFLGTAWLQSNILEQVQADRESELEMLAPHLIGRLTALSFHSQLQEAEVRNRDLEAHVRQLQERMEMLQAPGAAGESLTHSQPGGRRVEMGHVGCMNPGAGEESRLGHRSRATALLRPPRSIHLSLLLPAVTGVPSPRATDPPSHVRPLSSLPDSPLRSATHSPSPVHI